MIYCKYGAPQRGSVVESSYPCMLDGHTIHSLSLFSHLQYSLNVPLEDGGRLFGDQLVNSVSAPTFEGDKHEVETMGVWNIRTRIRGREVDRERVLEEQEACRCI